MAAVDQTARSAVTAVVLYRQVQQANVQRGKRAQRQIKRIGVFQFKRRSQVCQSHDVFEKAE